MALRFEGIAKAILPANDKYGDKWEYAHQEFYDNNLTTNITLEGRRALSTIIILLIDKIDKKTTFNELKSIDNNLWKSTNQDEIISIIEKIDYIIRDNKFTEND